MTVASPSMSALNGIRERTPPVLRTVRLDGFLSFAPGSQPFHLRALNVLVGPNGSGKTNLVEALRLLSATPKDLEAILQQGGEPDAWLWRGRPQAARATIDAVLDGDTTGGRPLRYRLEFTASRNPSAGPEVAWIREALSDFWFLDEWTFGFQAPVRHAQRADLPDDKLLPDSSNLALVLHRIEQADDAIVSRLLTRFFPRFERLSTRRSRGCTELFLHEPGFSNPVPAVRLSDGTLRFVALLAAVHAPKPPRLLCIENPELGLHPDAVALLGELLVEASHRMQLLITTHSDALVSALSDRPEAVVACERPGTATELRRLDPEKLQVWLDEYSLGDLWRMGELGANP